MADEKNLMPAEIFSLVDGLFSPLWNIAKSPIIITVLKFHKDEPQAF